MPKRHQQRVEQTGKNDLIKQFLGSASTFAGMKNKAEGEILIVFSVDSQWGIQDIVDFGPMKVEDECSDVHFCHDFHSVRVRFLDIPDRLLRQSSGA